MRNNDPTPEIRPDALRAMLDDFMTHVEFRHPFEFAFYTTVALFRDELTAAGIAEPLHHTCPLWRLVASLCRVATIEMPTDVETIAQQQPPTDSTGGA